jgi:FHA domain/Double zinc ribbon
MTTNVCPKGHLSTESDYCSECGAKIQTASEALAEIQAGANLSYGLSSTQDPFPVPPPIASNAGSTTCPACGAIHLESDGNFCEICGYNFSTGEPADLPIAILPPPPMPIATDVALTPIDPPIDPPPTPMVPTSSATGWTITIRIDPTLATPASPPAPTQAPIVLPLNQATNLIGRTSVARGVIPEIPIDFDDAVSHRHALLVVQADGSLIVRDVGSSNGVQYQGQDLAAMADVPLQSGDVFSLGHWTTIEVQQSTP